MSIYLDFVSIMGKFPLADQVLTRMVICRKCKTRNSAGIEKCRKCGISYLARQEEGARE